MFLMEYLNQPATVRMSLYLYSNEEDIDQGVEALNKVKEYFNE